MVSISLLALHYYVLYRSLELNDVPSQPILSPTPPSLLTVQQSQQEKKQELAMSLQEW